jgi:glycosyltransferase involved in cell wall biosynthesis
MKGKDIPDKELIAGLDVRHPVFFYLPGLFKAADGLLLFFSCIRTVLNIRKDFPFDMIDAHYGFPDGFAAVFLGKMLQVPVSITIRGNDVTLLPQFILRRWLVKYILREADLLVAVSGGLKKMAMELIEGTRDINVIMNSVDHSVFQPKGKSSARKKIGIGFEGQIILSVGAIIKRKGFQYLLEAAAPILKDHRADVRVYIVGGSGGEQSYVAALRKLVGDLNLDERVVFWGGASHEEIVYLYNAADLFCLFSEREGCPNVLMEAIACGLPSVVCGEWADRDMIPDDDIGYIAGSRDRYELESLIRKSLARKWDREKIRSFSTRNSWVKVAEKTVGLYKGIVR